MKIYAAVNIYGLAAVNLAQGDMTDKTESSQHSQRANLEPRKAASDWSNYWSGRAGQSAGEALAGKAGVETDPEIAQFWVKALSVFSTDCRFLDMACGAGSVVRRADALGFSDMTGADISPDAIATLKSEFKTVKGVVTSADKTPFEDNSFDVITSQFGLEYAGARRAVKEIARITAPGGSFTALCHMKGGAIEREVAAKKAEADEILQSEFIGSARAVFTTAYGTNESAFKQASQAFRGPQARVLALAKSSGGLAAHLYSGTQELYTKLQNFALEDVLGWLGQMEAEILAFQGRMSSMVEAALSQDDAELICNDLKQSGFDVKPLARLSVRVPREEIAYIFQSIKRKASG